MYMYVCMYVLLFSLSLSSCLLFYIEPLISKADNYLFLAKMFELIKQYVDAQSPDDLEINKV